jgi:tetratricopeptide (TPR) repeat protein
MEQGISCFRSQAWADALACFDQVAAARPDNAEVHNYRARTFEGLGRYEEALQCLDRALAIQPGNFADLRNRTIVLKKLGRLPEALESCDAALAVHPGDRDAQLKRALLLNDLDRREEALTGIQWLIAQKPDDFDVLNTKIIVLDNLERYEEALSVADVMLGMQPEHVDAINNTGMLLARLGRFKDALTCYNRSLALNPEQPQARYNRSLVRLALGDWIRGLQEFESRWETPSLRQSRLAGLGALWSGQEDLNRKTLLLWHEQGYGDTLQAVRYVSLLIERGARVVLAVPPALQSLLKSIPGVAQVLSGGEALPQHDYQCPMMSLPLAYRTTPDTIPAPVPYLYADASRVAQWSQRLGPRTRPRIGLVWGGRRYAPINYPRDVPLESLQPLLELDAQFIALQKDLPDNDRQRLRDFPKLLPLGETLGDFADTAALIANLDLVISADSAVAHLAGALGKPVWLMNRYASCWRWLQQGDQSAWYPTLRQFRQKKVRDWTSVISEVCAATHTLLKSSSAAELPLQPAKTPTASPPKPTRAAVETIRFVCATRASRQEFFSSAALGQSLPLYQTFPRHQAIELRLFADNTEGLPTLYNTAIEEARSSPATLVFIHDDVYLSDYYWADRLHQALRSFDIVGLVGNRRRVPYQASWMYLDEQFTCDNYDNFSGVLGHGAPFPNLKQLSVYGEPGQEVKLLDGVLMAVRSEALQRSALRFDPQFRFHFYDMDFCRQAELRQLRMGTCAISLVHASAGRLGSDDWRRAYHEYLAKYGEVPS